jgi:hypothetical protein
MNGMKTDVAGDPKTGFQTASALSARAGTLDAQNEARVRKS